jgi:hypothetical protein
MKQLVQDTLLPRMLPTMHMMRFDLQAVKMPILIRLLVTEHTLLGNGPKIITITFINEFLILML